MSRLAGGGGSGPLRPPIAPKRPVPTVLHGDVRVDDYAWLKDKNDPEVSAYLHAEDDYASAVMKPTEDLQRALYDEMLARIQETDLSVPWHKAGHHWYARTEKGFQYPWLCRRTGSMEAEEQVVLDLNVLAEGYGFLAIGLYAPSDDGRLLLFSTDTTGFREYTLQVKDLDTSAVLPFRAERVSSAAWAADGRSILFVTDDPQTKRPNRLWRHVLGEGDRVDLVHEDTDERFHLHVGRTRSGAFLVLSSESHTQSEARVLEATDPAGTFRLVEPRAPDLEYDVDHGHGRFYIRVNDTGRNFRLVTAPIATPSRAHWTEVIPHRDATFLRGVEIFKDHWVALERTGGLERMRVVSVATGGTHDIEFPEPSYALSSDVNPEFETTKFRFRYQSPITPPSVFDHDMATGTRTLLKETPVLGGYDRTRYAVERLWARAQDGTAIPVTAAFREDLLERNGSNPTHMTGYGSYGLALPASFSFSRISLMDRGFVCALAHVRGGGEMGKPWHDAGRMKNKPHTFSDFIAAAEFLIEARYTTADRLVIEGGSAGGLLVGAVVNARPDLFRAAILKVPFVDVVNTMLDEALPLTVGEFEEWGNPKVESDYKIIASYCPYTNLRKNSYPALLVKTSTDDSQVMFWEPAKYVAKLRALKTDAEPLLFKINFSAGHGGASGRYDALREIAFDYAFILTVLDRKG